MLKLMSANREVEAVLRDWELHQESNLLQIRLAGPSQEHKLRLAPSTSWEKFVALVAEALSVKMIKSILNDLFVSFRLPGTSVETCTSQSIVIT